MQPAIQVCVRRNGRVVLDRAIGHAWGNGPADPPDGPKMPVTTETPFCVYSAAKAITTTVAHMLVERGAFSLEDRVCEYLPSYTSHGKDRTTIRHVLTHSAGVPFATGPRPNLKRMDDSDYAREMLGRMKPVYPPGLIHIYHGVTWGPLMREIISAATGRNIRDILHDEILAPLGFRWTNYGVAPEDVPLVAPSHVTGKPLPAPIAKAFKTAVGGTPQQIIPFSNTPPFLTGHRRRRTPSRTPTSCPGSPRSCAAAENSTASGCSRRRRCAPRPRARRLRPDLATGLAPMRWGTGYMLGSKRFGPFGRDAAGAFGHTGLTDIAVWADPTRALSVAVVSSGKPGGHREAKRYPALLDRINAEMPRAARSDPAVDPPPHDQGHQHALEGPRREAEGAAVGREHLQSVGLDPQHRSPPPARRRGMP